MHRTVRPTLRSRVDLFSVGLLLGTGRYALRRTTPAPAARRSGITRAESKREAHVLAQDLFRDALARERARAQRFDQSFALLLIELVRPMPRSRSRLSETPLSTVWINLLKGVTGGLGETAIVGWFVQSTVLGAIVPGVSGADAETLVRLQLARCVDAETLARCSISWQPYTLNSTGMDQSPPPLSAEQSSAEVRRAAEYPLKRALDVVGTLTVLVLLAPVFLLIAVLLKLSSTGPVLFRQPRMGQLGKPFTMLKFRTMRVNADPALHLAFATTFIKCSAQLCEPGGKALFKLSNDPRVTPLGRILRKSSLDELPQLWNVLRGDMSLVGPRPPLPYEVRHYRSWHWRRILEAKPGITGLWQVTGRSRTTFDEMVRLDLRYAQTCSLWTDIKILLATPRAVVSGEGAQ